MTVDVDARVKAFLGERNSGARPASFDFCFNHFQDARDRDELDDLKDGSGLVLSSLHLGFYLASWGMMRGSGELSRRSVRELFPVVRAIVAEPPRTWAIDVHGYETDIDELLEVSRRIRGAFMVNASDTLVTKTMLGVFGCVPAFDRYFRIGFGCSTLCRSALEKIGRFYQNNTAAVDGAQVLTLDVATGLTTDRRYPRAKIIDMVFSEEGIRPNE